MSDPANPIQIIEIAETDLSAVGMPAKVLKVPIGPDRNGFVFTLSYAARLAMNPEAFVQLAQQLGNLVHPSPAVLAVLPDGATLGAYCVVAE